MVLYLSIIFVGVLVVSLIHFLVGEVFLVALGWTLLGTLFAFIINVIVVVVFGQLMPKRIYRDSLKIYQVSPKEIAVYNFLRIKSWKEKILELGVLGGFKKGKIENSKDSNYLRRYIYELNKGMVVHFMTIMLSCLVMFIPPMWGKFSYTIPVTLVSMLLNIMPLMVLRYNKPRLKVLIRFAERRQNAAQPTAPTAQSEEGENDRKWFNFGFNSRI